MPRKIIETPEEIKPIEEDENEEESEEGSEEEIRTCARVAKPIAKPKRVLSEKQLEHLSNIRLKAIEAKKKQALLTQKANELKNIQKQEKLNEKIKEAEKYDAYIQKQQEIQQKQEMMKELREQQQQQQQQQQPKQPQRKIKKVIYEDEEEDEPDYSKLVAMENLNKLHQRALNERIFNSVNAYANALRPNYY